ncbi:MAG: S8 family serine peptidase [Candidatus Cloacimonetes bacterium]|nr:S8 family serine peptidase [Candidatus Cloacimonadota bacterium]
MRFGLVLVCFFILLMGVSVLVAYYFNESNEEVEPDQIVVKLKPEYKYLLSSVAQTGFGLPDLDKTLQKIGVAKVEQHFGFNPKKYKAGLPDLSLILRITYRKTISPLTAADLLMRYKYFEYAEPLVIDHVFAVPNDSYYSISGYLRVLQAEGAWDIHKGINDTAGVLIAIVDTGVNWKHADIKDNIYINTAELTGITINWTNGTISGGNSIDDDANGKIDDVIGWDFMASSGGAEGNNPFDSYGHGSAVAGIANARTNNTIGVSAIPWNLKLLPISCSYGTSGTLYKGYEAIIYAAENDADVINYSAGSTTYSTANEEAIAYATGLGSIIVAAAGNNNSASIVYPAGYPRVVGVAAVLNTGVKGASSSYGRHVDVCAPTDSIYSITSGAGYNSSPLGNLTSYASPIATGLAALIKSAHSDWTNEQIVNQLVATCTNLDADNPLYINMLGDGMLNAAAALTEVNPIAEQELRLGFKEVVTLNDANANLALEQNELFSLSLSVRNYAPCASSNNVTFTLSCSDPDIIILNNTYAGSIPKDGYSILENAFQCRVSVTAVTKAVTCTLTAFADIPITANATMTFSILISAGGVFVWEGKAEAGYSGRRIRDTLTAQGHSVFYTTTFPFSFATFSAVFLSFGMVSTTSNNVTRLDRMKMFTAIHNHLLAGGRIYLEGNDVVGFDLGYYLTDVGDGQSAADVLWPLLGIASADDGSTNAINNLAGQSVACTKGITFTASTQTKLDFIDRFTPISTAATAFIESDYGNVAVQNYGFSNQKSFIMSYCLNELTDCTGANKRDSLLYRIMQDFQTAGNALKVPPAVSISQLDANHVRLSWDAIPGVNHYVIYAAEYPDADFPVDWLMINPYLTDNNIDVEVPSPGADKRFYRVIAILN